MPLVPGNGTVWIALSGAACKTAATMVNSGESSHLECASLSEMDNLCWIIAQLWKTHEINDLMAPDTNIYVLSCWLKLQTIGWATLMIWTWGWHVGGATGKMEFWHEVHLYDPSQSLRMYFTGSNCSLCHAATCNIAEEWMRGSIIYNIATIIQRKDESTLMIQHLRLCNVAF